MILSEIIQQEVNRGLSRLDAELLLAKALNVSREKVFLEMGREISCFGEQISGNERDRGRNVFEKFIKMAKKRLQGVPLAYLTGVKEFYGLEFEVSDGCLVPRPETELLVDVVLDFLRQEDRQWKIADVGTGSGCIAIAIAKNAPNSKNAENVRVYALDNSEKALKIARRNVRKHFSGEERTVKLLQSDLLSALNLPVDVVVANLPYISDQEQLDRSVLSEPKNALVADQNGLGIYERLFEQIAAFAWRPQAIFFEIGFGQVEAALAVVNKYFEPAKTHVYNDLAGIPRAIAINF